MAVSDGSGNITNPGTNVANYLSGADWNGQDGNVTKVGSGGPLSASYYGSYDQAGNVWEWNEGILPSVTPDRIARGGAWNSPAIVLNASYGGGVYPTTEVNAIGFRLASSVPEPSRMMLLLAGVCGLVGRRRRLPFAL